MLINNSNVNIDELLESIDYETYKSHDNGHGILLTNYQIQVLKRNGFDYEKYSSLSELLFDLNEYLSEDCSYDELDWVATTLEEMHYYTETNK